MFIRIDLLNPKDISFSETFPNPDCAVVLRIENNEVYKFSNGDWLNIYESNSIYSTFYRVCTLMTQVFGMIAENTVPNSSVPYTENDFAKIIEQLEILTASIH